MWLLASKYSSEIFLRCPTASISISARLRLFQSLIEALNRGSKRTRRHNEDCGLLRPFFRVLALSRFLGFPDLLCLLRDPHRALPHSHDTSSVFLTFVQFLVNHNPFFESARPNLDDSLRIPLAQHQSEMGLRGQVPDVTPDQRAEQVANLRRHTKQHRPLMWLLDFQQSVPVAINGQHPLRSTESPTGPIRAFNLPNVALQNVATVRRVLVRMDPPDPLASFEACVPPIGKELCSLAF